MMVQLFAVPVEEIDLGTQSASTTFIDFLYRMFMSLLF